MDLLGFIFRRMTCVHGILTDTDTCECEAGYQGYRCHIQDGLNYFRSEFYGSYRGNPRSDSFLEANFRISSIKVNSNDDQALKYLITCFRRVNDNGDVSIEFKFLISDKTIEVGYNLCRAVQSSVWMRECAQMPRKQHSNSQL